MQHIIHLLHDRQGAHRVEKELMNAESRIVFELADEACRRVCRRAISALQKIHDTTSPADSGLINAWDEICVQVQGEQSVVWCAYEYTIQQVVQSEVEKLKNHVRQAIWLQTDNGFDWLWHNDQNAEDAGDMEDYLNADDIADYIINQYVVSEADNWTNRRIEAYLDSRYG